MTVDDADHLAELQLIDMDLFDEALQSLGVVSGDQRPCSPRRPRAAPAARLAAGRSLAS